MGGGGSGPIGARAGGARRPSVRRKSQLFNNVLSCCALLCGALLRRLHRPCESGVGGGLLGDANAMRRATRYGSAMQPAATASVVMTREQTANTASKSKTLCGARTVTPTTESGVEGLAS